MKIRNGFVSNSSSSSFIVAFPHKPKNEEDLKQMMFGKNDFHYVEKYYTDDKSGEISVWPIIRNVYKKIGKKATKKEIAEALSHGGYNGYRGFDVPHMDFWASLDDPEYTEIREMSISNKRAELLGKYNEKVYESNKKRGKKVADYFVSVNKGKYFVILWFSDNDGEAIEEHTDIFRRLEYIRVSCH